MTVRSDLFKKKMEKKKKERKYNGLRGRQKFLSRPDFPFRSVKTNTDP